MRVRTGGACGVPRGVSAGSPSSQDVCERSSSVGTCGVLSSLMASVPYARVNESVANVNRQVEYEHRDGDEGDDADNQRLVAVQVRVDEIVAESRHGEDALDDDGAGDEYGERGAGERDDRQESAAQRVVDNHLALAEALRARRADIVRAQHFEHPGARQARDVGHVDGRERQDGQNQIPTWETAPARGRQPVDSEREDEDEEGPEHEVRQRDAERSEERRVGKECRSRWSPYH